MIGVKLNDRYEILEHLGEGSTATVYRARDTKLGRDVALKVLLPHVRETTRKRFFQESQAAAQLNHPNIMAIYDIGADGDRHYLVVEYVQGDSLTKYIPSSSEVVIDLGTQIALALDYAHERDIIHRDIKPANIKVTPEGKVKIMDLGLALGKEAKRVTAPGMVIGTPAYISPEQAQGHQLDKRTDIYSLGIVLYEMATGQLPFNADDITALLMQHVQQPAPPPRLIVDDMPKGLESVILKTLEKNPNRRFQTCRTLAEALDAARPHESTMESPTVNRRPEWAKTLQSHAAGAAGPSSTTQHHRRAIRVVLADDHTLLRRTLANLLEANDDFVVLAEAGDGESALNQVLAIVPDVLLLDLNMPGLGGLDILPRVREQAPSVKVLILTGRDDDSYIVRALSSGAHGYILKSTEDDELVDAIRKVVDGQMVLGRGVAEKVVTGLLGNQNDPNRLSEMETKLLMYVAAGYENNQIGQVLEMGMVNVIETLASAMNKLNVKDRNSAALKAMRQGDITLEDLHNLPPPPES